jgi:hypothetical protein
MRPTIAEQLRETRRILNDMLIPVINDDYMAQIMKSAFANLEMLESAWENVLPFLHWDNETTVAVLRDVRDLVSDELAVAIDNAKPDQPCDPFDVSALQSRNVLLQSLICQAVGECDGQGLRRIQAHLLERTARYPMRPAAAGLANARPAKEH